MKVNIENCIKRAAKVIDRAGDEGGYAYMLRDEFLGHLKELRDDPARHGEFFALYRFSDGMDPAPAPAAPLGALVQECFDEIQARQRIEILTAGLRGTLLGKGYPEKAVEAMVNRALTISYTEFQALGFPAETAEAPLGAGEATIKAMKLAGDDLAKKLEAALQENFNLRAAALSAVPVAPPKQTWYGEEREHPARIWSYGGFVHETDPRGLTPSITEACEYVRADLVVPVADKP